MKRKLCVSLCFIVILIIFSPNLSAQNGIIKLTPELKQEFVNAHNKWRADVGVQK